MRKNSRNRSYDNKSVHSSSRESSPRKFIPNKKSFYTIEDYVNPTSVHKDLVSLNLRDNF